MKIRIGQGYGGVEKIPNEQAGLKQYQVGIFVDARYKARNLLGTALQHQLKLDAVALVHEAAVEDIVCSVGDSKIPRQRLGPLIDYAVVSQFADEGKYEVINRSGNIIPDVV